VRVEELLYNSNIGAAAGCFESKLAIGGGNCGNMSGRTYTVNGTTMTCGGNFASLPAKVNGGYCLQATAGSATAGSYFGTW
jgi:hypothetical protein